MAPETVAPFTLTAEEFRAYHCGEPVGWRVIRGEAETCTKGCLAPGSSPHSHPPIVTYFLIGTTGYAEVDATTHMVMASGVIRPFPVAPPQDRAPGPRIFSEPHYTPGEAWR